MSEPTVERIGELLAGKNSRLIQRTDANHVTHFHEITRHWERIQDDGYQSRYIAYLDQWTDPTNYNGAEPTLEVAYVDNPVVGKDPYTGRWRIVSNDWGPLQTDPAQQGAYQVLRKGYAETISWDEAVLLNETRNPAGGDGNSIEKHKFIMWRNLDPTKLEAMVASLTTDTITDPVVQGQTLTGTWEVGRIRSRTIDQEDEGKIGDGSGIIVLNIAQPKFYTWMLERAGTGKERKVETYWSVPKYQIPVLRAQYLVSGGADYTLGNSGRVSYTPTEGFADVIFRTNPDEDASMEVAFHVVDETCDHTVYHQDSFGVYIPPGTEAAYFDSLIPPFVQGTHYSIIGKRFDEEFGTWDYTLVKSVRKYVKIGPYKARDAFDNDVMETKHFGVRTDSSGNGYEDDAHSIPIVIPSADNGGDPDSDSDTEGTVVTLDKAKNSDDCSETWTVQQIIVEDQTAKDYVNTYLEAIETETHTSKEEEEPEVLWDDNDAGTLVQVQNQKTPEGRFRTSKKTMVSTPRYTSFQYSHRYGTATVHLYQNRLQIDQPTFGTGVNIGFSTPRVNDDKTFTYSITETPYRSSSNLDWGPDEFTHSLSGLPRVQNKRVKVDIRVTNSRNTAAEFLTGNEYLQAGGNRAGIFITRGGKYKAVKLTDA